MGCECPEPLERLNRFNPSDPVKSCMKCGRIISREWTSNDDTLAEFFDRLKECWPADPPRWFASFRRSCEVRERRGRVEYKHRHLSQDNAVEAMEEAADGALYAFFCILQDRREGSEEEWITALTAAKYFAEAYHQMTAMRDLVDADTPPGPVLDLP